MARDKATGTVNGAKHALDDDGSADFIPLDSADGRSAKKVKLLDASDDEESDNDEGVSLKINEEYAQRFEHNKKREEKQRCELSAGPGLRVRS